MSSGDISKRVWESAVLPEHPRTSIPLPREGLFHSGAFTWMMLLFVSECTGVLGRGDRWCGLFNHGAF